MQKSRGPDAPGLKMHLQKCIPHGGGLGGGSSDAARTLLGINQLWNLHLPIAHLSRIAADLGSDVPFFLHGPSSVCTGRGEIVQPIPPPKARWAILFLCDFPMPTAEVYRRFDQMKLGARAAIEHQPPWTQWADLSAGLLLQRLVNDLESPAMAISPQLKTLREDLENIFDRPIRMSGSGSSLFTLFDDLDEANAALKRMKNRREVRATIAELAPKIDDDVEVNNESTPRRVPLQQDTRED